MFKVNLYIDYLFNNSIWKHLCKDNIVLKLILKLNI